MAQEKYVAYVGTYTHENSVGIHIYDVDVTKGYMKERKVVPINNPSDLVVSKNRKFLYSIADEGVEAFKILKDGDLEPINEQWIGGMRGCYVEVDDENRYLFVGGHHDGRVVCRTLLRFCCHKHHHISRCHGRIQCVDTGMKPAGVGRHF